MDLQIITFYEFKQLNVVGTLTALRDKTRDLMRELNIRGTVILAEEGYNATVCGTREDVSRIVGALSELFDSEIVFKSSFSQTSPFRRIDVKIKPEIVTLKRKVDMELGSGTHVSALEWNDLISDPRTLIIDTRNDYEYRTGTFRGAINPGTEKFSDLPEIVERLLEDDEFDRVAMFCTGGIRCEKFAPYLKQVGYQKVFQLEGGILRYLDEVPRDRSLWEGECFVFDDRITVGHDLRKGVLPDKSQNHQKGESPSEN